MSIILISSVHGDRSATLSVCLETHTMEATNCVIFAWILALLQIILICEITANTGVTKEPASKPMWNATWTDKLKMDLLLNYDKFARPAQHTNTTTVTIDMTFIHIELDELKALMTVHGWVKMVWMDEKLQWNESDYGGLAVLHLADHEIWQPDIVLYNSASGTTVDHYGNTHCLAHTDGTVLWVPPTQFIVFCDMDLRFWPFDTQTCMLKLGSWTYDGFQIDLQLDEEGIDIELLTANTEWKLLNVTQTRNTMHYACCTEPYIDVTYEVTLQRKSPTYTAIVITPATVIVLMTLVIFWLPPSAGEKIILSGCTAIIISLHLIYFSQKLPAMAGNTPLIVTFFSSSLYLVTLSMVLSVGVMNLARQPHLGPLPWMFKNILTGVVGRSLGLGHLITLVSGAGLHCRPTAGNIDEPTGFDEQTSEEHQMISCSQGRTQMAGQGASSTRVHEHEWTMLATAIDRIAFLIYCFIFAILAMLCAV